MGSNRPVLESPAPARSFIDNNGRRRRNLSFRVLHCNSSSGDLSPATAIEQQLMMDENYNSEDDVVVHHHHQVENNNNGPDVVADPGAGTTGTATAGVPDAATTNTNTTAALTDNNDGNDGDNLFSIFI